MVKQGGSFIGDLQQYLDQALSQIKLLDTDEKSYFEEHDTGVELGELIISTCKGLGITQKQLAQRSGIPQASTSKIEDGNYHPGVTILERIADGFGKRLVIGFTDSKEGL